jgi:hypothetical protein
MSRTVGTLIRRLVLGSFLAIILAVPAQAVTTYQLTATPTYLGEITGWGGVFSGIRRPRREWSAQREQRHSGFIFRSVVSRLP